MLFHVSFVLLIHLNTVHCLKLLQINEKLGYIEDRINAESKFRRDDFKVLVTEINSLKEMMQQSLEIKTDGMESKDSDQTGDVIIKELEEKILRLTIGFKEEKNTNVRLRRKTQDLYRQVFDLQNKMDKTADILEKLLKGIEFLTKQKEERENYFKLFDDKISEIKISVQNLTETIEQTKSQEEHRFDTLESYTENITENIEHLKAKEYQCFEKVNIKNGVNITEKEENDKEKINYEEHHVCSCPNTSFVEQSAPSPEQLNVSFKSCKDLYNKGIKSNGIYQIDIGDEKPLSVYCDMETDGGGWTVFQRRQDGSVDFFRDWNAYKYGFGDLNGELWLGNKYINILTSDDQQHELRIDLEDFKGYHGFAKYDSFKVRSEEMQYKLEVNGYSGNTGDSLEAPAADGYIHNNMKFSTKDVDNDNYANFNCAISYKGAWWFNRCFGSHLNGVYSQLEACHEYWQCIIWDSWKGWKTSIKFTEMKLR